MAVAVPLDNRVLTIACSYLRTFYFIPPRVIVKDYINIDAPRRVGWSHDRSKELLIDVVAADDLRDGVDGFRKNVRWNTTGHEDSG